MGENDVGAALGSLVCAAVAGQSMGRSDYGWMSPLMHVNLTCHGILGVIHYQNSIFGIDTSKIFPISMACARYLAIAGLNADIYRHKHDFAPALFLLSGAVPLYLEVAGQKNEQLGIAVVVLNCCAIAYHAYEYQKDWAWLTVGGAIVACIAAPNAGVKALIPLGFAALDYCGFRIFFADSAPPTGRR